MPPQDMLINYVPGEECRIALVEDGKLEELYTERASDEIHVGNIYRGRVTNVEPSIQAAFIDFGLERNGFLHVSDLHPRYFPGNDSQTERVGHRTPRKERPPIQQCLKRGQRLLVQVLKEGIGTKGPTLTSYLSIPGRFLVMMPDMERHGVSRKIEDEEKRREMRKILDDLDPPSEFGFIVRTAGIGRTKTELKRDLAYLMRLWKTIESRQDTGRRPAELYRESDLVIRTLRDVLTNDVKRIIVDDRSAAERAKDFIRIAMPRASVKVIHYDKPVPLLDSFNIERQIETIHSREVPLSSGGSLVIDTTEALIAIDVNSGKSRDNKDAEATAYETNKEAIPEIARQLRLRDLGGLVVLDLIDMYQHKHRRAIEQQFRDELKKDRARSKITRINDIGLLSLTRQRMRPSLKKSLHQTCSHCKGTGVIRTAESVALDVMRRLAVVLSSERVEQVELRVSPPVGAMLLNRKRHALHRLEQHLNKPIEFKFDAAMNSDDITLIATDSKGVQLDPEKLPAPKPPEFDDSDLITFDDIDNIPDEYDDEVEEDEHEGEEASAPEKQATGGDHAGAASGETSAAMADDPRQKPETGGATSEGDQPSRPGSADADDKPTTDAHDDEAESPSQTSPNGEEDAENTGGKRKRRRRRRGGRGRKKRSGDENAAADASPQSDEPDKSSQTSPASPDQPEAKPTDASDDATDDKTNHADEWNPPLTGTGRKQDTDRIEPAPNNVQETDEAHSDGGEEAGSEDKPRKRRRRRGGRGRRRKSEIPGNGETQSSVPTDHNGDQDATEPTTTPPAPEANTDTDTDTRHETGNETGNETGQGTETTETAPSRPDNEPPSEAARTEQPAPGITPDELIDTADAPPETKPKSRRRGGTKHSTTMATSEPADPDQAATSEPAAEPQPAPESNADPVAQLNTDTDTDAGTDADADADAPKKKTKSTRKKQTGKTTKKKTTRRSNKSTSASADADADAGADSESGADGGANSGVGSGADADNPPEDNPPATDPSSAS